MHDKETLLFFIEFQILVGWCHFFDISQVLTQ